MNDVSHPSNPTTLAATSDSQARFDVHLFAVVRVKFSGVVAVSMHEAIPAAIEKFFASGVPKQFDGEMIEFADEFSHFLVDVVGDLEFEQSRSMTSRQEPLLALLDRLVAWDATGRPEETLAALLAEARSVLEWSV